MLDGGAGGSWTVMNSWILQLKFSTSVLYSCWSWIKWDKVQVTGSCTFWFGNYNCCSEVDREPTKLRKRVVMVTLVDIWAMTLGVMPKPPILWGIWNIVIAKSISCWDHLRNEPHVPFCKISYVIFLSTCLFSYQRVYVVTWWHYPSLGC